MQSSDSLRMCWHLAAAKDFFGQFGRPNWPNGQWPTLAKLWPNDKTLVFIKSRLVFGRGQRFFWPFWPAKLAKRATANPGQTAKYQHCVKLIINLKRSYNN